MRKPTPKKSPIDRAVKFANINISELARRLKLSPTAVRKWRKKIPAERVAAVERETGYPRCRLRPDLYPDAPKPDASGVGDGG